MALSAEAKKDWIEKLTSSDSYIKESAIGGLLNAPDEVRADHDIALAFVKVCDPEEIYWIYANQANPPFSEEVKNDLLILLTALSRTNNEQRGLILHNVNLSNEALTNIAKAYEKSLQPPTLTVEKDNAAFKGQVVDNIEEQIAMAHA